MSGKSTSRLAIQMTLDGVSSVLGGARSVVGGIGSIGGALRKMSQDVFYGLSNLRMLQDLAAKPIEIITSVVQANASRETAVLQFQTLLGSAEAAQAQIKELAAFAANTPFELPEVLNAARTLQTFGKSALNNKKALTSIGDAAAASGKPFEEVAFWVGRMYGSLSSGQPFAEAINRFTEMAVIGPETAAALRKISDEGTGTAETINLLFAGMDAQGAGGMKRLSASFSGMVSTMKDNWNEFKILVGAELFGALKTDLEGIAAGIDKAFATGTIQKFAAEVGGALRGAHDAIKTNLLGGITADDLFNAAEQGKLLEVLKAQFGLAIGFMGDTLLEKAQEIGPKFMQFLFGGEGSWLNDITGTDATVSGNERTKDERRRASVTPEQQRSALNSHAEWMRTRDEMKAKGMIDSEGRLVRNSDGSMPRLPDGRTIAQSGNAPLDAVRNQAEANRIATDAKRVAEENLRLEREWAAALVKRFNDLESQPALLYGR